MVDNYKKINMTIKNKDEMKEYNPYGKDKQAKAIWECLKRMYKEAKPSADIEKISKSGEGKMQGFFFAYYLSQDRADQILKEVCKEFKIRDWRRRVVENSLWMGCSPNSSEKTWKEERKDYDKRLKEFLKSNEKK